MSHTLISGLRSALRTSTRSTISCSRISTSSVTASTSSPRRLARRSEPVDSEGVEAEPTDAAGLADKSQRPASWRPLQPPTPDDWKAHRAKMKKDFPAGWAPPRKLSRDAMDALRDLHALDPVAFTTETLADRFQVSPEAVRRILRSSWAPSDDRRQYLLARENKMREEAVARRYSKEQEGVDEIEREMEEHVAEHGPLRWERERAPRRPRTDDDRLTMT